MTFSLYAATIPSFQQVLRSVAGLLDKAEAFCVDKGIAPEEIIQARLADDMLPFAYQVKSTAGHSAGAIEALQTGVFSPDMSPSPATFVALKEKVALALATLDAVEPQDIEDAIGRDMRFQIGEYRLDFTAENFLLSFSQPNFYFHATTAYDILRHKGLPIGKRDYMGQPRLKA